MHDDFVFRFMSGGPEEEGAAGEAEDPFGEGDEDHEDPFGEEEGDDEEEEDEGEDLSGDELEAVLARERAARGGNRPIDDAFDMLLEEYDSEEDIGELDPEDPRVMGEVVDAAEQYSAEITEFETRMERNYGQPKTAMTDADRAKAHRAVSKQESERRASDDDMDKIEAGIDAMFKTVKRDDWDVESIVSTYTNTENHPNMIKIPRKDRTKIRLGKAGVAVDYMPQRKVEPVAEEAEVEGENEEVVDTGARRDKEETKEEKKARKEKTKEAQRAARDRKRNLKGQYAEEISKQIKDDLRQKISNSSHVKL
jgi:protein LTV1